VSNAFEIDMGLSLSASSLRVQLQTQLAGREAMRQLFDIGQLNLSAGQSLALYGPSGSGKTTLLNLLAGLSHLPGSKIVWGKATLGQAECQQDITELRGGAIDRWRLRNIGLVFQQFQLLPTMTALENVLAPYRFDHWRCPQSARERATVTLKQFGIAAKTNTGCLSRGEQQRVALARALVRTPDVILADEPTASLDPVTAAQVMDILIQHCRNSGLTLIVATHDSALAPRFDRALTLRDGQLIPLTSE
jgi:putative ABC transport system ATP-binding protein